MCGGQRTAYRGWCFPSAMWGLGAELRLSDLAARPFIHGTISLLSSPVQARFHCVLRLAWNAAFLFQPPDCWGYRCEPSHAAFFSKHLHGLLHCMCACYLYMWAHMLQLTPGGQRTALWCRFTPFTFAWLLEIELQLPRLHSKILQLLNHHTVLGILYLYFQWSQQFCKAGSTNIVPIYSSKNQGLASDQTKYTGKKSQSRSLHLGLGNWRQSPQSLSCICLEDEMPQYTKRVGWTKVTGCKVSKCEMRVMMGQVRSKDSCLVQK